MSNQLLSIRACCLSELVVVGLWVYSPGNKPHRSDGHRMGWGEQKDHQTLLFFAGVTWSYKWNSWIVLCVFLLLCLLSPGMWGPVLSLLTFVWHSEPGPGPCTSRSSWNVPYLNLIAFSLNFVWESNLNHSAGWEFLVCSLTFSGLGWGDWQCVWACRGLRLVTVVKVSKWWWACQRMEEAVPRG